ncbi:MAG: hypothetical protein RR761_16025, partial [Aeromonas sp.]|uniref:hypothetical protein n=1 Tax=Aeromonas sp. TaxID=647 RepID=UPI002FC99F36
RPSGYEPDELPSCSTPRLRSPIIGSIPNIASKNLEKVERVYYIAAIWCFAGQTALFLCS